MELAVIPCSLRRASANRGLARAAVAAAPDSAKLLLIDDLPLFSEDHELAGSEPALEVRLQAAERLLLLADEVPLQPQDLLLATEEQHDEEPDDDEDETQELGHGLTRLSRPRDAFAAEPNGSLRRPSRHGTASGAAHAVTGCRVGRPRRE